MDKPQITRWHASDKTGKTNVGTRIILLGSSLNKTVKPNAQRKLNQYARATKTIQHKLETKQKSDLE